MFVISKGTKLFRAAESLETKPKVRECSDTGKIGVYFSCFHPYLAETMCLEYNRDLEVGVYEVIEDIDNVTDGKYSFRDLTNEVNEVNDGMNGDASVVNVAHIDFEVGSIFTNVKECKHTHAELFLTENELPKIKYIGSYHMSLKRCISKWIVNDELKN